MHKIYLCGHTGSRNRGCEAILRSTVEIFRQAGELDINAFTFDRFYDEKLGVDQITNLIPYPKKNALNRVASLLAKTLLDNSVWGAEFYHRKFIKNNRKNLDLLLNIGGDTYCYGTPNISYALNNLAQVYRIPIVFWGFSLDDHIFPDEIMERDLNQYTYLVVRESLTYKMLQDKIADKDKIFLACDPAFQLPVKVTDLPEHFIEGNTFGINLSPLIFTDWTKEEDIVYQNVINLIDYLLRQTDMNICFIPHVYRSADISGDLAILKKLYSRYKTTKRVSLVSQELSCMQLKYIISKCRFFIGARTHSMIAAYSTQVPAFGLSYSLKSRGIALDVLGSETDYILSWDKIRYPTELLEKIKKNLLDNESAIHRRYHSFMPEYRQAIVTAAKAMMKRML